MQNNAFIPNEFIQHVQQFLPAHLTIEQFLEYCNKPLRKSIRVNTLKIDIKSFEKQANAKGWILEAIPWCEFGYWIEADESETPLGNTAEHMAGLFYIQEASSMMPVTALQNALINASTVLDMAAAPGSKTTQIASIMNNKHLLVANEFSASRVKTLHANIERCGISNCALTNFDARVFGQWLPESFDAILLDAPCSGEGTIRKDTDALKNWSLSSSAEIASTQKDLIESAFQALKPNGVLVYSTCALSVEENQHVCHHLKELFGDAVTFEPLNHLFPNAERAITPEGFLHIFPQIFDSEGFFVARIRKNASIPTVEAKKKVGKFPFGKATAKQANEINDLLKNTFNITIPNDKQIWIRDKEVWLFPNDFEPFIGQMRFSRIGIKIAEMHKTGYRWQHQVATSLTTSCDTVTVDLVKDDAREWFMGRDIRPEGVTGAGEVLVSYSGMVIGLGKWVGNRIKNGLPRELVRDKNLF
ncbi:16S rRNA (cytosine(1407)-C(5))-methyltransferase RsmF [Vibrio viridaestus]|uniref:Ribosomal RNA small subunit methyltransferase F n=1 Tax=Vibrio viridaestus TaxID=2487322 RepID=A0A3N9THE0_9VIBR|nr:16S rRNA (cytosine(1407)-C(5))-methyltransferase RsmF [Vibrio viridaestus]RQW63731.1 16S rRNA (cytosine(1407)-C(5))-methyltransferase RsmF [Vibrio viridaestus]